ncbi:putative periplasmic aspartyl protease [Acidisarcina polymorpha]|uniref:Putative periplasmic aspartyl protease n=1 Tax=Acidisarcina polymorpha TaxID=2211140 RepID=A0A2Z5G6V8_9BACT|nr:S53 family peptidase [Acidisarcina polymorpha]AXC14748.1 putative periplasmic aspartyl protease [Acidisarcina polymorpha]
MRYGKCSFLSLSALSFVLLPSALLTAAFAQSSVDAALEAVHPFDRVVLPVDDEDRVVLYGNTLPQALLAYQTGTVESDRPFHHILLELKPDASQQSGLDALLVAQQNPDSPLYRQWLTPEIYAEHFGASNADIEQVQRWLERYGLQVDEIAANHRTLLFSGTSGQVEAAFHTSMRTYRFGGEDHLANATEPTIPLALSGVINGVVSLHDLFSTPQHRSQKVTPEYSAGGTHYLSPADFAAIYDVSSLYHQAYDGSGVTIAILGRSDITLSDIRSFRSQFGLAAKDPVVIVNGSDPGRASQGDYYESMLDVEWSGAVASKATIDFVTSASTAVSDGVFLSALYAVNRNVASIVSLSYGLCEASLGAGGNSFLNSLWQQAAVQGMTILVSAGDSGAAGCDSANATRATHGRGVNGMCSTPYNTCVGGTEFNDLGNPAIFWGKTNGVGEESALGYIPEVVWNESGSSGLWSTGGGASSVYPKPAWQTGSGVPKDGRRDLPDVALSAAGHDGYLVQVSGGLYVFSGTSAAAPSFAGLLALVEQKMQAHLGNANPQLYKLAAAGGGVFHDIVSGNNSVPGVTGYSAAAGYDPASGLGSVDAEKLVTAWGGVPLSSLTLSVSRPQATLSRGDTETLLVKTIASSGFNASVTLALSGLPPGVTAKFAPAVFSAPGAGNSVLTLTASKTAGFGSSQLLLTAAGGGLADMSPITLTVVEATGNTGSGPTGHPLRRHE